MISATHQNYYLHTSNFLPSYFSKGKARPQEMISVTHQFSSHYFSKGKMRAQDMISAAHQTSSHYPPNFLPVLL